jgi:hypothetical protein
MSQAPNTDKNAQHHPNYIQAGILVLLAIIAVLLLNKRSETSQPAHLTATPSGSRYVDEYDLRETISTQELWRAAYEATVDAERWATVEAEQRFDAERESSCTSWAQASRYIGTDTCLCGTVTTTYRDPQSGAFFIDFSSDRSAFYVVSFDYYWENMTGGCIQVCGTVTTYDGRPQIIIRDPASQLFYCP